MSTQDPLSLIADFIANLAGTKTYIYSPSVWKSGCIYLVVPAQYIPETKAYAELIFGNTATYAIIPSDVCYLRMSLSNTHISVIKSFNRTIKSGALSE